MAAKMYLLKDGVRMKLMLRLLLTSRAGELANGEEDPKATSSKLTAINGAKD